MVYKKPSPISFAVSEAMRRMPERSTGPEMTIRRALFSLGLRYRIQYPVPGIKRRSIDIAFPGCKVAVFIDGCFWHGCSEHRTIPKNNHDWWENKIEENRTRDRDTDARLKEAGWLILRYWEHDAVEQIVAEVFEAVRIRRTNKRAENPCQMS